MKIAIIGSGGREHALVHHLSNSKKITKIYSIPGNAGTEEISVNIDLNLENFQDLYNFIKKEQIEWVIVCLLYTSPSSRDLSTSRMPSSA